MAAGKQRPFSSVKEQIKDLLAVHKGERRGITALMFILLVLAAWAVYEQWYREPPVRDLAPLQQKLEAWAAVNQRSAGPVEFRPFPFDPNSIGREEWRALGLSDRQVDGLERYLSKGGRFRKKKDLAKMYSIRPEQYAALEPYILLPDSVPRKSFEKRSSGVFADRWPKRDTIRERAVYARQPLRSLELNSADTTALIALPGIGPAFARGIVKYRDLLGGYVSLDQLNEVFVLSDKPDAVLKLKQLLILDTLSIRRIPINTCTVEELAAHPYFRWKLAKPLIAFRTQHGPFRSVEGIQKCALIDPALLRKLAPYLTVE